LCAYADGELNDSSKQLVEDHLVICENCSAILKMYKEISDSVSDTNVPAPDALCIGVMNRLKDEETPRTVAVTKRRKTYQYMLTRYAPVAACLLVVLLVWQFWTPISSVMPGMQRDGAATMAPQESAPEAALHYSMNDSPPADADMGEGSAGSADNERLAAGGSLNDEADDNYGLSASATPEPVGQATDIPFPTRRANFEVSAAPLIPLIIDEDSITPTGVIYEITNNKNEAIEFGEFFILQVLSDAEWSDIGLESQSIWGTDVLHINEPGEARILNADWRYLYGSLPAGTYRLVKTIKYSNSDMPEFYIAGEFIIR